MLLSREAMALGLDARFERPERIREWVYEFDPAGFELLRRAIERVAAREPGRGLTRTQRSARPDWAAPAHGQRATLRPCERCPSRGPPASATGSTRSPRPRPGAPATRDPAGATRGPSRLAANLPVARRVVAAVNATRREGEPSAQAGELAALELLHEIFHLLVDRAAELQPSTSMADTAGAVDDALGEPRADACCWTPFERASSPTSTAARTRSGSRSCC